MTTIRSLRPVLTAAAAFVTARAVSSGYVPAPVPVALADSDVALSPKEFRALPITAIKDLSPNTKLFKVGLPSKESTTGLKTSSFVMIKNAASADGKFDARPYTPTSLADAKGELELVIKSYPGGKVTQHLFGLKVGDSIEIKGPLPKLKYEANMKKSIGLIAGGTGITPCLQIIQEVINNPKDETKLVLVFANNGEEDILLKDRLDGLAKQYKQLSIIYVVATPGAGWEGEKGFVTEQLLKRVLPAASDDVLICVCGPPGMMNAVSGPKAKDYTQGELSGILNTLGFSEANVFKF
jgi:cytochrome-b5 reductase